MSRAICVCAALSWAHGYAPCFDVDIVLGVPVFGGFINIRINSCSVPASVPYKGAVMPYVVSFPRNARLITSVLRNTFLFLDMSRFAETVAAGLLV